MSILGRGAGLTVDILQCVGIVNRETSIMGGGGTMQPQYLCAKHGATTSLLLSNDFKS